MYYIVLFSKSTVLSVLQYNITITIVFNFNLSVLAKN